MREIKFRGYDTDSKCWRYGYYFRKDDITLYAMYNSEEKWEEDKKKNEHHLILFNGFSDWGLPKPHYQSEVDGDSIGQYTGLKDKNDKEIYEGDILAISRPNGEGEQIVRVFFENGQFVISHYAINLLCERRLESEVIGNIYENPELLEGGATE